MLINLGTLLNQLLWNRSVRSLSEFKHTYESIRLQSSSIEEVCTMDPREISIISKEKSARGQGMTYSELR